MIYDPNVERKKSQINITTTEKVWDMAGQPSSFGNQALSAAKRAKNDEFYTQWSDIEREINLYLEYNPNVFKGKTILLPCDDPEWSNFTKFFALHFQSYGLKKLISTSYAPNSNAKGTFYKPTLFETSSCYYSKDRSMDLGRVMILGRNSHDQDNVNIDDLQWAYLEGDGDFRSKEVTALRDEADIIITNPPFSLFREFVAWLVDGRNRFSVIGSSNATTYSEIFPLIQNNKMWKGATANASDMVFAVPQGAIVKDSDRDKAERLGYPSNDEYQYTRLGNSCWFTNIDHGRRHEPLQLMTMAENLKFSRHQEVRTAKYRQYDNYDAIEVPYTDAVPSDFDGVMGVPISFLDKYNPDQFEIVGTTESNAPDNPFRTRIYTSKECRDAYASRFGKPGTYDLNASGVVDGIKVYKRVLIRKRKA